MVRGAELMCILAKCNELEKLRIKYCSVSNRDIQAIASGCLNLGEVLFRKCWNLTLKCIHQLRASRASLVVDFDKDGRGTVDGKRHLNRANMSVVKKFLVFLLHLPIYISILSLEFFINLYFEVNKMSS